MNPVHARRICLAVLALCAMSAVMGSIIYADNDFVVADLRTDLTEVNQAWDYRVNLMAYDSPSSPGGYTTTWLGVDLDEFIPGVPFSAQFTQVGLMTDAQNDVYWFVYAEPGVECLEGDPAWQTSCPNPPCGCVGDPYELVSLNTWHWVELVTYEQGYWIARVYEADGYAHDVAKIWSSNTQIWDADVAMEEAYSNPPDPYLSASFYHWHPQWLLWGTGFQEWPESINTHKSTISAFDQDGNNTFCPDHYGATPNWLGDPRAWYAGTGGHLCNWVLFPGYHDYLPIVLRNYP